MSSRNVSHRGRPPERHRDRPRHRHAHSERHVDVPRGPPPAYMEPVQKQPVVDVAKSQAPQSGVMVVSVIGRGHEDASQLLDRLLDAQVFTSGLANQDLPPSIDAVDSSQSGPMMDPLATADWPAGLLQHHYSQEQGIVYIRLVTGLHTDMILQLSKIQGERIQGELRGIGVEEEDETGMSRIDAVSSNQPREMETGLEHERGGRRGRDGRGVAGGRGESRRGARSASQDRGGRRVEEAGAGEPLTAGREGRDVPGGKTPLVEGVGGRWLYDEMREAMDSVQQQEAEAMRALLLAFCVSHVVILMQDHARFDPQLLRTFRILQGCKHALLPSVKSRALPALLPSPTASPRAGANQRAPVGSSESKGAGRQPQGQPLGSSQETSPAATALLPGQYSPVLLFVYPDDYAESASKVGADVADGEPSLPSANSSGQISRSQRGPGSSGQKSGPGNSRQSGALTTALRKKAQSSLESQIRFLIKKCRTLGHPETSLPSAGVGGGYGASSRGGASGRVGPGTAGGTLFALDPTRVVVFLDRAGNRPGAILDSISGSLEDIFSQGVNWGDQSAQGSEDAGEASPEGRSPPFAGEGMQTIREFVHKQVEALRGKGGAVVAAPSGPGGGVVAAAATTTALAGSGEGSSSERGGAKGGSPPLASGELPSFALWASACRALSEALAPRVTAGITGKSVAVPKLTEAPSREVIVAGRAGPAGFVPREKDEEGVVQVGGRGPGRASPARSRQARGVSPGRILPLQLAPPASATLACLESASDVDFKFSVAWCRKVFPAAQETYLRNLPEMYTTAVHEAQLSKAVRYFKARVKGRAVEIFTRQLQAECEKVWKSGRQQCDAVSLTGRLCIHRVHSAPDAEQNEKPLFVSADQAKPEHSTVVSLGSEEKFPLTANSHGVATMASVPAAAATDDSGQSECRAFTQREHEDLLTSTNTNETGKPHSSGAVFLHACNCGRSRRIRADPFDFHDANVDFFAFPGCCENLPSIAFPNARCHLQGTHSKSKQTEGRKPMLNPSPLTGHSADANAPKPVAFGVSVNDVPHSANVTAIHLATGSREMVEEVAPTEWNGLRSGAWSLVKLGGAEYYDPAIGLQLEGFISGENFLSAWEVSLPTCKIFETDPERAIPSLYKLLRTVRQVAQSVKGLTAPCSAEPVQSRPMEMEQTGLAPEALLGPGEQGAEGGDAQGGDDDVSADDVALSERRPGRAGRRSGSRGRSGSRAGEERKSRAATEREMATGEGKQQPVILTRRQNRGQPLEGRGTLHVRMPHGGGGKPEHHPQEDLPPQDDAFPPLPQRQVSGRGLSGGKGSKGAGQSRGLRWERKEGGSQGQVARGGEQGRGKGSAELAHADEENKVLEAEDFPPLPSAPRPGILRLPPGHKRTNFGSPPTPVGADVATPGVGTDHNLPSNHGQVSCEGTPLTPEVSTVEDGTKGEENEEQSSPTKDTVPPVDTELVRLYVGLEHECPRGHRSLFAPRSSGGENPRSTALETKAGVSSSSASPLERNVGQLAPRRPGRRSPRPSAGGATPSRAQDTAGKRPHVVPAVGLATEIATGVPAEGSGLPGEEWEEPGKGRRCLGRLYLESQGEGAAILGQGVPIFRMCAHCEKEGSGGEEGLQAGQFYGGAVAQLQRIFIVTPLHPVAFSTFPLVEFPPNQKGPASAKGQASQATPGQAPAGVLQFQPPAEVVLPPNSTVCLRLPFVYPSVDACGDLRPIIGSPENPESRGFLRPWTAVIVSGNQATGDAQLSDPASAGG